MFVSFTNSTICTLRTVFSSLYNVKIYRIKRIGNSGEPYRTFTFILKDLNAFLLKISLTVLSIS